MVLFKFLFDMPIFSKELFVKFNNLIDIKKKILRILNYCLQVYNIWKSQNQILNDYHVLEEKRD